MHFQRRDYQICDTDEIHQDHKARRARGRAAAAERVVCVPLQPGSFVIFNCLVPHGTPTNKSNSHRRAIQLHYAPPRVPKLPESFRLEHFGAEGKNVTC